MAKSSLPELLVPRAEAKEKITAQIEQGREILEFLTRSGYSVDADTIFDRAEGLQTKWVKYTIDLFKLLIRDPDHLIHIEFGSDISQYPPGQDLYEAFQERMSKRIHCLESIVERLPLFPLAVEKPSAVAVTSARSQQPNKERVIVHRPETAKHDSLKLFISWSGDLSHRIALSLREWLPVVLPFIDPWVSSEDIIKGTRWAIKLASELEDTHSGIVCLVHDNLNEPWLYFEAGALSKSVETACIHPFLVGIDPGDLPGPLAQFQATCYSKDEMRKLVYALNSESANAALPAMKVDKAFDVCWPDLESRLGPLFVESCKNLIGDPQDLTAEELKTFIG